MSRYQEAGVDIHAGYELVNKIKNLYMISYLDHQYRLQLLLY